MLYLIFIALAIYFVPPIAVRILANELGIKKIQPTSNWWRIAACTAVVVAIIIHAIFYSVESNFILHALGGGVAASLVYVYIKSSLGIRVTWKIDLLMLFAFVSMLGVLNEIAEFGMDLLQLSVFSIDRYDTWRDLVANTSGGFVGYGTAKIVQSSVKSRSQ